ncbi:MAG: recombination regulator RecX [Intrasporangiaceae bacterium]|nr:recombination regulator RecX [Intrasporangiaceae bacterium]
MDRIAAAHPDLVRKGTDVGAVPEKRKERVSAPAPAPAEPDADADPYAVARAIVLRQLTMGPRSRHQLREKLRQRDCPDDVAEAVLDRMTEVGLVDDEKYAEALVRSKQVSRGLSKRGLAHELRTKGVDRDIADEVLAQVTSIEEGDRARALVDARLPRLHGLERDVVIRRLAGMLGRKGYPAGLSLRVIREAIDADPAFRRD